MPNKLMLVLVYGLLILIVFFAVLSAVLLVMGPAVGTATYSLLETLAMVSLCLAISDGVLLLIGLGMQSLNSGD